MNAAIRMLATRMHFAISLPSWNSLDSVRRVHSDLEITALVFFALLVVFDVLAHLSDDKPRERLLEKIGLAFFAVAVLSEIVAYPYGQRNDELSAQIIVSLDAKAESALGKADAAEVKASRAEMKADKAEEKSGNAVTRAGNAEKSLGRTEREARSAEAVSSNALILAKEAQEANAWRHVSSKDAKAIRDALPASLRGYKIEVRHLLSDPEASKFASEIADALRPVLNVDGTSGYLSGWGTIPQGVGLYVKSADMPGAGDVQLALKAGGVKAEGALLSAVADLHSDTGIVIFVWPKPPPQSHNTNKPTAKP